MNQSNSQQNQEKRPQDRMGSIFLNGIATGVGVVVGAGLIYACVVGAASVFNQKD